MTRTVRIVPLIPEDDNEILALFLAGDQGALKLVDKWIRGVVYCKFHFTNEDANDLVLETIFHVFRACQKPGFKIRESFKAFVRDIACKRSIELHRKEEKHPTSFLPEEMMESLGGQESNDQFQMVISDYSAMLKKGISSLTKRCQEILGLRFWDRKKYREIADVRGVAVGTIRASLNQCLDSLRPVFNKLMNKHNLNKEDFLADFDF